MGKEEKGKKRKPKYCPLRDQQAECINECAWAWTAKEDGKAVCVVNILANAVRGIAEGLPKLGSMISRTPIIRGEKVDQGGDGGGPGGGSGLTGQDGKPL